MTRMKAALTPTAAAALLLLAPACASYTPIRTHFNKGVQLYGEENWSGAAREYRLALEDDPMDHRARFNLAMTHEKMERPDLAREEYQWILSVRPDDLRASVNLAASELLLSGTTTKRSTSLPASGARSGGDWASP